jgi:hypothetical protein
MTDVHPNPFGREYTPAEFAAARRLGIVGRTAKDGPLIYAGGPYLPDKIRQMAADATLLSAALDREWSKPTANDRARALQVLTDRGLTRMDPDSIRVTRHLPGDVDRALMLDGKAVTYVRIEYRYDHARSPGGGMIEVTEETWNSLAE